MPDTFGPLTKTPSILGDLSALVPLPAVPTLEDQASAKPALDGWAVLQHAVGVTLPEQLGRCLVHRSSAWSRLSSLA